MSIRLISLRLCFLLAGLLAAAFAPAVSAVPVTRMIDGSPLDIIIGDDTSFQVLNANIPNSRGQIYPTPCTTSVADAGIFAAIGGQLYAPDFGHHSCGTYTGNIGASIAWTPVAISPSVTGNGTAVNPFRVTVEVKAGTSGVNLIAVYTYVNGEPFFRLSKTFVASTATTMNAYLAMDIYLANADEGIPFFQASSNSPGGKVCDTSNPGYTILLIPTTPAAHYTAKGFGDVWSEIGTKGDLSDTVATGCVDNGAAIQWRRTLEARASTTILSVVSFGPENPEICLEPHASLPLCEPNGAFTYTLQFRNRTSDPISHVFLVEPTTGVALSPNYFHFDPPVGAGQLSPPKPVTITGASPGDTIEFLTTIHIANFDMCCSRKIVFELPRCECAQLIGRGEACSNFGWPFGSGGFTYSFDVENLEASTIQHLLLAPKPPATFTIQPNHFPVSMGFFGSSGSRNISVHGPGSNANPACFLIGLFDATLTQCCAIEECVRPHWCFLIDSGRWEPIGGATVIFRENEMLLSGLGETGTDGVATDLNRAGALLHWRDLDDRRVLPAGASLWLAADIDDGSGPRPFGEVQVVDTGNRYTLRADFSEVSASGVKMVAFLRHRQVASVVTEAGELGQLDTWPQAGGVGQTPAGDVLILGLSDVLVHLPSGEAVVADRLLIGPSTPPPSAAPVRLQLRAARFPQIIVADFGPAFDCNTNGVEDDAEVAAGEAVDANHDGILDACVPTEALVLNLNTGFDEATQQLLPRGSLPGGTSDPDWQVVQPALGASKLVIHPVAVWPPAQPQSQWISVSPNRGLSLRGTPEIAFERCFCLAPEATAVTLSLSLIADDLASVLLNNNAIATGIGGFSEGLPANVSFQEVLGGGLLVPGRNCLRVVVHDSGGGVTGLDLRGTLNAERGRCPAP